MNKTLAALCAVTIAGVALLGAAAPASASDAPADSSWAWDAAVIALHGNVTTDSGDPSESNYDYSNFALTGGAKLNPIDDTHYANGTIPLVESGGAGGVCWKPRPTDAAFPILEQGSTKLALPSYVPQRLRADNVTQQVLFEGPVENTISVIATLAEDQTIDFSACDQASGLDGHSYIIGAHADTSSFASNEKLPGEEAWFAPVRLLTHGTALSDTAAVTVTPLPGSMLRLHFEGLTGDDRAVLAREGSIAVQLMSRTDDGRQLGQTVWIYPPASQETPAARPPTTVVSDPGPQIPPLVFQTGTTSAPHAAFIAAGGSLTLIAVAGAVVVATRRRRAER